MRALGIKRRRTKLQKWPLRKARSTHLDVNTYDKPLDYANRNVIPKIFNLKDQYLQRTGQLNAFMEWLKNAYPQAYRERVKAWKFRPA